MDQLLIKPSRNTPELSFNPGGGIRLKGRSIHEDAADFYQPVLDWVNVYINDPADSTCVDIQLEYFNSASAKYITKILQHLKKVRLHDKKYFVNWFYEEGDEDIFERGEYIASVLDLEFNFIEIS